VLEGQVQPVRLLQVLLLELLTEGDAGLVRDGLDKVHHLAGVHAVP